MNQLTEIFLNAPGGIFTLPEVATVLPGSEHRRNGLIKRAIARNEIVQVRRGVYCLAPRFRRGSVSAFALAQRLHGPGYISFETALAHHGWIPEAPHVCASASLRKARRFDTPLGLFTYHRVPQRVFYAHVDRWVDRDGGVALIAAPQKALADLVYLGRQPWSGIREAADSLRIEQEDWRGVPPKTLADLAGNYTSRRVRAFLTDWVRENSR